MASLHDAFRQNKVLAKWRITQVYKIEGFVPTAPLWCGVRWHKVGNSVFDNHSEWQRESYLIQTDLVSMQQVDVLFSLRQPENCSYLTLSCVLLTSVASFQNKHYSEISIRLAIIISASGELEDTSVQVSHHHWLWRQQVLSWLHFSQHSGSSTLTHFSTDNLVFPGTASRKHALIRTMAVWLFPRGRWTLTQSQLKSFSSDKTILSIYLMHTLVSQPLLSCLV